MSTAAEQYRSLVNKLESLYEADYPKLRIGDIDPRNGKKILSALTSADGTVVRSGTGDIWNVKYGEPDKAPERRPDVPNPFIPAPQADVPNPPADIANPPADVANPPADVAPEPAPDNVAPKPEEPCGPEVKAQIMAQKSFNAAYAMAKKAGCPDFDWCQIVTVPTAPVTAPQGKVDWTGQSDPLGGDMQNPMSFAPNSNFGAEEGYESDGYILEDELVRVREIANTQVVEAAGLPEIKAGSKAKAIEIARKKGIARFKFCGKYKVTSAKQQPGNVAPKPERKPQPQGKVDWTGQSDPLGGDMQNPMSFAPNSNFGA
jgi:hypothetical protein